MPPQKKRLRRATAKGFLYGAIFGGVSPFLATTGMIPCSFAFVFPGMLLAHLLDSLIDVSREQLVLMGFIVSPLFNGLCLGLLGAGIANMLYESRTEEYSELPECPQCGYNLTGNTSGICPECGNDE